MKILMVSVPFYPHIGGIESVTEYLANEFVRLGHKVKVITRTPELGTKSFPYEVIRRPKTGQLWSAYRWCDVFVHQGISLYWAWPAFTFQKPWFIVYHLPSYPNTLRGGVKRKLSLFARNICVSKTVGEHQGLKQYQVILNSCNMTIFKQINPQPRKNFVFVGRLLESKGVYLLLDAFRLFKQRTQSDWTLTIVGPAEQITEKMMWERVPEYFQSKDIVWVGEKTATEVAKILNQHQVQIAPSIKLEAFGVVVLEGMAAGCLVIGSDGDGIAEAMGKAGYLFTKGDVESLCQQMIKTYQISEKEYAVQQQLMKENIKRLSLENCAKQYIAAFEQALSS